MKSIEREIFIEKWMCVNSNGYFNAVSYCVDGPT
jgi:hypothetical protein